MSILGDRHSYEMGDENELHFFVQNLAPLRRSPLHSLKEVGKKIIVISEKILVFLRLYVVH